MYAIPCPLEKLVGGGVLAFRLEEQQPAAVHIGLA
jgi:hypothetical protein